MLPRLPEQMPLASSRPDAVDAFRRPRGNAAILVAIGAVVVWIAIILPYGGVAARRLATEGVNDFTILRVAGARAAEGRPLYGPLSPAELRQWPYESLANLNLPHTHVLLRPLAAVSYRTAATAWAVVSMALLAVSLVAIVRELGVASHWWTIAVGGSFVLGSAPYISNAVAGELSFVLMAPFTAGWIAARRGRSLHAGAWLGLCAAVKPFLGLFLFWFLLTRLPRAAGAFVASIAIASAIGIGCFGVDSYVQWFDGIGRVRWWWPTENASLRGVAERLFVPGHGIAPLTDAPSLANWAAGLGVVLVLIVTMGMTVRVRPGAFDADEQTGAWLCASLLASPLGWIYYGPMLTGPFIAAVSRRSAGRGWLFAGASLLMIPLSVTEMGQPSPAATVLLASVYTWALVALWIGFLSATHGGRTPDAQPS